MPSLFRVRLATCALATIAAIAVLQAAPAAAVHWKNAARIGQTVSGLPNGEVLGSLLAGTLNLRSGRVVFEGKWGTQAQNKALFAWTDTGGLELLLAIDDSSIWVEGTEFSLPAQSVFGGTGGAEFVTIDRAATAIPACPGPAPIYQLEVSFLEDDSGGFVPVVAPGMPVPGIEAGWIFSGGASNYNRVYGAPNAAKSSPGEPASNTNGDIAFYSWIRRAASFCEFDLMTPYARAVFGPDGAGSYTLAALDEDPAPGAGDGAALIMDFGLVELNDAGEIAFQTDVRLGPSGPTIPAIYRWDAENGLRLVTLSYQPGVFDADTRLPGVFHFSDGGQVAFVNYAGTALFVEDVVNGVEERVAAGDPAPGLPAGFTLEDFARWTHFEDTNTSFAFAVNALGDIAFSGRADFAGGGEPSRLGVWGPDASGALTLRMVDGQDAPGVEGATIDASDRPPSLIAMSDQRELLIAATLAGPEPTPRVVYYLIDADGNAQILLRSGDGLAFAPGDFEAVQSGGPTSFDADLDHFAFLARSVTNREAIFYGQIPEVGGTAAGLAAVASLCALRARRRVA